MDDAILVVDDELNFRNSLQYILEKNGFKADLAASGKEALLYLQNTHYQAVLLDLLLPDIDGLEIAEYLNSHHPDTAIIVLTGHATTDSAIKAMRHGVYDYLNKPSKPELVLQIIKRGIETRRLKQELIASKAKFQQLADATWEGIAFVNEQDQVTQVNRQLCELFGHNENDLHQRSLAELVVDWPTLTANLHPAPQKGAAVIEATGMHRSGRLFPIEIRIKPIGESTTTTRVAAVRDISVRKREEMNRLQMQEELTHAQRMESIGLMVGSVAHDLNNILTSIVTFPELLLMDNSITEHYRKDIAMIQQAGKQAAAVVADLLTIARGATCKKEPRNLNHLLEHFQQSLDFHQLNASYPDIDFDFRLAPDLYTIQASNLHITKSIINLITNSVEAIAGPGQITIKTSNICLHSLHDGYEQIPPGAYVVLEVSDTGPGIPPEVQPRIFEPFFSKKEMGRSGTGLGLAIIWNTIRDHHGYLDVASNSDGSRFELFFPICTEQAHSCSCPLNIDVHIGNGEKILVVDDETDQLTMTSSLLKRLGYTPFTAENGEQAIQHIRNEPVDLLLLDMWMEPGINGYETYQQILEFAPDQKAIFVSGYFSAEDQEKIRSLGITQHLTKPFSATNLAQTLRQEINRLTSGQRTC